jgi:hypothetical protein
MDLTKFTFKGYHYDNNTVSRCNSVFYVKDDNEDEWLEIIPVSNAKGFYMLVTVEGCETAKVELCKIENGELIPA